MKKIIITLLLFISIISLAGCATKESRAFKEDYEKLNGQKTSSGKEHRSLNISEDNPFIEVSAEEIVKKIENKETFYVYFGSTLCPWCRSVIEKAIEIAKKNNIKTIYYVDIWDDKGNEILRDKYEIKDKKVVKVQDGTESYSKLLQTFDSLLRDYNLTNEDGNEISTGEKRIYAPNYFYIKNGEAVKLTTGKSDKQTDSRQELTDEILNDEENKFNDFFKN